MKAAKAKKLTTNVRIQTGPGNVIFNAKKNKIIINESINQSFNRINESMNESMNESINESMKSSHSFNSINRVNQ